MAYRPEDPGPDFLILSLSYVKKAAVSSLKDPLDSRLEVVYLKPLGGVGDHRTQGGPHNDPFGGQVPGHNRRSSRHEGNKLAGFPGASRPITHESQGTQGSARQ